MMRPSQKDGRFRSEASPNGRNLDFNSARSFVRFALSRKAAVEKTKQDVEHQEFEAVAEICVEGVKLAQNEAAWLAFIESSRWDGVNARPKAAGQRDAVRYMLRLYAGTENTKRSSLLWRAVKPYVTADSVFETVMTVLFTSGSFKEAARLNVEDFRRLNENIDSEEIEERNIVCDEVEGGDPAPDEKTNGEVDQDTFAAESHDRHSVEVRLLLNAMQYRRISTFKADDEIVIRGTVVSKTKVFAIKAQRFKRVEPKEQA